MLSFSKFTFYRQLQEMDCGPTCLKIVASHYGKLYAIEHLRNLSDVTRAGVNINDIEHAANAIGFNSLLFKTTTDYLKRDRPFPLILHWRQNHFIVLHDITSRNEYVIADPKIGVIKLTEKDFCAEWKQNEVKGIALLLEPTSRFYTDYSIKTKSPNDLIEYFKFSKQAFLSHKKNIFTIMLFLAFGTVTAYLFPYTMQKLVDRGIQPKDTNMVSTILLFQLALFLGDIVADFIRSVAQVHLSMQISIKVIRDFLYKLILLPVRFFDTKTHADIYQRIEDQNCIQTFLTTHVIQFIFSVTLIIVLSVQLAFFNMLVFSIFLFTSILSIVWVMFFYQKRNYLNYNKFSLAASNRNNVDELIAGMSEVKINSAQQTRIKLWEQVQQKLYKLEVKSLNLSQYQLLGVRGLSQVKSIVITGICAYAVLKGHMSLGTMLGIGYIVGQLKMPIEQMVDFLWTGQDAKIAFDRLNEIQKKENECNSSQVTVTNKEDGNIYFEQVNFKYPGNSSNHVLENLNFQISKSKITAIVGSSGSGKTSLMKLLLKFYDPTSGAILINRTDMKTINAEDWRKHCGVVMQDGYIFSGSIAENIAMADEFPSLDKLVDACKIACIDDFVDTLPLGLQTKIGKSALELSGGQRQRILIARAVYANPRYLFFDEATSALDANNETKIMKNLNRFFNGKTVVIIAHRLSTVKNAHQIIVLEDKKIVEEGDHNYLTKRRGKYYELIKNQLELGS